MGDPVLSESRKVAFKDSVGSSHFSRTRSPVLVKVNRPAVGEITPSKSDGAGAGGSSCAYNHKAHERDPATSLKEEAGQDTWKAR